MSAVTLSPKYQLVIPKKEREQLNLKPGQKFQILVYNGRLELVPVPTFKEMSGIFKGKEVEFEREPDREL